MFPSRYPTLRRTLVTGILPVLLVLGLAACGGSNDAESSSSSQGAPAPAGLGAFAECLAEQGVELPAEGETPDFASTDLTQLRAAIEACGDLAPEGLPSGALGGAIPDQSAIDAIAACLEDRDVIVEPSLEAIRTLDPDNRKVQRAMQACAALIAP